MFVDPWDQYEADNMLYPIFCANVALMSYVHKWFGYTNVTQCILLDLLRGPALLWLVTDQIYYICQH